MRILIFYNVQFVCLNHTDTPLFSLTRKNVLRVSRPALKALGITLGGWRSHHEKKCVYPRNRSYGIAFGTSIGKHVSHCTIMTIVRWAQSYHHLTRCIHICKHYCKNVFCKTSFCSEHIFIDWYDLLSVKLHQAVALNLSRHYGNTPRGETL